MKTERVQDQKEKMQAELQALWKEQCDQLRKKKEQFATEVSGRQKQETTVVDECLLFSLSLSLFFITVCLQPEHFQLLLTHLKPEFAGFLKDFRPSEYYFFVYVFTMLRIQEVRWNLIGPSSHVP